MPAAPGSMAEHHQHVGGRIARIEMVNFKSYGGKRIIGPFLGFSAVVGPNGAGKSNLMDAISFNVGLRSSDLRGKQLKDLIYRCSTDSGNEERSASVSLVYERDGKETVFTRSISSAGVGEYRVDGRVVKADAYSARLKSVGIITKAHSGFLVFQGYISELAGKSPMELTQLFEQISGSDELKDEYERLEREKKKAEEEQIYSYQKKKGLAQERTTMRKQKEEAERYMELQDDKRELQKRLYLLRLFSIEKEIALIHEQVADARTAVAADEGRYGELEEAVKENEKAKAKMARKVVEMERKAVQLQQTLEGKTPEAIQRKEQILHAERRKKMSERSLEKLLEQQTRADEQLATLQSEHKEITARVRQLESENAESEEQGELSMGDKQRAEYNALKAQVGTRTAALTEQVTRKKREIRDLEPTLVQLRTRVEELSSEKCAIEAKLSALSERRTAGDEKSKELAEELRAMQKQAKELTKTSASSRSRRTELEGKIADLQGRLRASKADHRESERERKAAEAMENLKRLFTGVHGRMTDICTPTQRKYHAAVTIAMGKNMDAVVVDEQKVAMQCIEYLKKNKFAPETFIPLDTIKAKPARDGLRELGGTKKPAQDIVSAPERFVKAIQFAVGDALVCDTLEEARQLAYHTSGPDRYKVVTLDGTLINKAGLITGGSSPGDKARSSKWDHKEYEALKAAHDSAARELEAIGDAHTAEERELALRHSIASKQQEIQSWSADLDLTKTKLTKHESELSTLTESLQQATSQLQKLADAQAHGEAEMRAIQEKCDAEEDTIFAQFSKSLGVSSVREYEEKHLRKAREREAEILALKQQQSKLQARVQFEQRKDLPAAAAKLRASIEEDEKLIAKKKAQQAKAEAAAQSVREETAAAEEEAKQSKDAQEKLNSELKTLKKELRSQSDKVGASKVKLTKLENDLEQQRGQRQRIFQRARLEEVKLPLVSAETEPAVNVAGVKKGGSKRDRSRSSEAAGSSSGGGAGSFRASDLLMSETFSSSAGLVGTGTLDGVDIAEDEEETGEAGTAGVGSVSGIGAEGTDELVRIDFSSMEIEHRTAEAGKVESDLTREVGEVSRQIDSMTPNMKAITQFDEVQARLHSIESEFDETRSVAKTVSQQFAAVQAKRYQLFMTAFKAMSESIDDVYKELTQVEGVPLGGTAYLSLEDPSEPYLYGTKYTAMPAGKRFRDMDQLSGGERTVAALALLFAMHKFRPSPFLVMDEIDAALDNVNVTRVAQYIRERASDGSLQFVVISLKDQFYHQAQGLVGIYRDRREECSACATLNLDGLNEIETA